MTLPQTRTCPQLVASAIISRGSREQLLGKGLDVVFVLPTFATFDSGWASIVIVFDDMFIVSTAAAAWNNTDADSVVVTLVTLISSTLWVMSSVPMPFTRLPETYDTALATTLRADPCSRSELLETTTSKVHALLPRELAGALDENATEPKNPTPRFAIGVAELKIEAEIELRPTLSATLLSSPFNDDDNETPRMLEMSIPLMLQ